MNNTPCSFMQFRVPTCTPCTQSPTVPASILFGALQVSNCQPIDLDIDTPIEDQMCSETKLLRVPYNTVESIQLRQNLFYF